MTSGPDWRVPASRTRAHSAETTTPAHTEPLLERAAVVTVPALLSVAHTAVLLDCSVRTVRRRIATGDLPAVVEGERVVIRGDDLKAYIDDLKRIGDSPRRRPRRRGREGYDFLG